MLSATCGSSIAQQHAEPQIISEYGLPEELHLISLNPPLQNRLRAVMQLLNQSRGDGDIRVRRPYLIGREIECAFPGARLP